MGLDDKGTVKSKKQEIIDAINYIKSKTDKSKKDKESSILIGDCVEEYVMIPPPRRAGMIELLGDRKDLLFKYKFSIFVI